MEHMGRPMQDGVNGNFLLRFDPSRRHLQPRLLNAGHWTRAPLMNRGESRHAAYEQSELLG